MIGSRALLALTLLGTMPQAGRAQDTTAVIRHLLSLDISRVSPFRRAYDVLVRLGDSSVVIGQRELALDSAVYAGTTAWLLTETRTGAVPSVESLYVAPDLRPIHWSSSLGAARLGAEFVGDSIYGAVTMGAAKQNIVALSRPDLLLSTGMVELLLPLLPLTLDWSDSVAVIGVDLSSTATRPATLAVVAEQELTADSARTVPGWLVELRGETGRVTFLVDRQGGAAYEIAQSTPAHVGDQLQFRRRAQLPVSPAPP